MKSRIEEIVSRILSKKYDAKITIKFKERDEHDRNRENDRRDGLASNGERSGD